MMKIRSLSEAYHLQRRLGFGTAYYQAKNLIGRDLNLVLDDFIFNDIIYRPKPNLSSLDDATTYFNELQNKTSKRNELILRKRNNDQKLLTEWWLQRIQHSSFPLQERMTVFWHGYFTSSMQKVGWPQLMYRQNSLYRKYAVGNFKDLLHAVCFDPAMLIYLDGQKNTKLSPNENFARELLELFTLGEGHYSEQDVISAARAFTGHRYHHRKQKVIYNPGLHDNGLKDFMGETGRFNGSDIINILLNRPRTSEFFAEKLWSNFINPGVPDAKYIASWSRLFRDAGYSVSAILRAVFQSEPFWSNDNRGSLIKSPIEFTIGLLRELKIDDFASYNRLRVINKQMGQDLFYPPDVKGWRGGKAWISNESFVLRNDFVHKIEKEHLVAMDVNNPISSVPKKELSELLLPILPVNEINRKHNLLSLLQDPAYQLR